MFRSRHRYPSPSPTARNPPFTEDGTRSKAVFHLSARKSGHLTLCPRSLAGSPANQVRAWIIPHPQLLLTILQDLAGHRGPEINHAAVLEVSPLPAAGIQALWAPWQVVTLSVPTPLRVARNQAANPNSPMMRKMPPVKMKMLRQTRVGQRLQAMARWHHMAKMGRHALKLMTPSPALAKSSVHTRTQTPSLTPGKRSSPSSKSGTKQVSRRTAPPRNPVSHLLRMSLPPMRHSVIKPGKELDSWTHVSMLGVAKRLLKVLWAGPPETP